MTRRLSNYGLRIGGVPYGRNPYIRTIIRSTAATKFHLRSGEFTPAFTGAGAGSRGRFAWGVVRGEASLEMSHHHYPT